MIRKVRTTMRPDVVLEVEDEEFVDLQRQGLLLPGVYAEQFDIAEQVAGEQPAATEQPTRTKKEAK